MRHVFLYASLVLLGSGYATLSRAETVINIHGKVTANPCTVDADTVDKQIDLGTFYRSQLTTAGQGSDWNDFSLLLTQCPVSTTSATVTFSGTADTDDATAFKNSGDAANVALRLSSADHATTYSNGGSMKVTIDASTKKATFPPSARIFTPKGGAGAGSFNSVLNVDFTYE
ncbi:fimbrial protein [Cronobacter turicensis]|uniref:fimbrial protein n=1 Tax=Cronobacter turicensis TaxID=413502 RepID=UPI003570B730